MRIAFDRLLREKNSDVLWASVSLLVFLVAAFYWYLSVSLPDLSSFRFDPYTGVVESVEGFAKDSPDHPQPGDQILRIGDVAFSELTGFRLSLSQDFSSGDMVTVVVRRGDQELALHAPLRDRPPWEADSVAKWFFPLVFWFMGTIAVIFLRPRDERWLVLVVNYYNTAIWLSTGFNSLITVSYSHVIFHGLIWLFCPLSIHLHLVLPDSIWRRSHRYVLPLIYGISVVFSILDYLQIIASSSYLVSFLIGGSASLCLLVLRLVRQSRPEIHRANRIILLGTIFGVGPLLVYLVSDVLIGMGNEAFLLVVFFPLWPWSYVYALYRPNLGIVEYRANRFFGAYSFFALYLLTFAAVFGALTRNLGVSQEAFAVALLVSIFFVAIAPTLRSAFQRKIDRNVFGVKYEAREVVSIFSRRIPAAHNRTTLRRIVRDEVLPTLMIRQSALYLATRSEEGEWIEMQALYKQAVDETSNNLDMANLLSAANAYIPVEDHSAGLADWIRLVVPLQVQDKVVGVWLLGRRDPDDFYSKEDINLLSSLAGQIGPVIENFRLVELARQEVEENKKLQKQLLHSQKMEAIGSLSAGVAHDFNNLLSVILGNSYLLLEDYEDDVELSRFLGEIRDAGEKASSLTRQLLTFSRQGTMEVMLVDLNDVVDSITQMLAVMAGKNVELFVEMGEDLPPIRVDPDQMSQVIINLTVNARDAMPDGGEVRVRTSRFELVAPNSASEEIGMPLGRYVLLQISDNGTGIPPEVRSRIFEPFFTTKEPGKGTGLGLSMVYGIVNQCKGYIYLDSEVGRGTTFNIFLPAVEDEVIQEARLDDTIGESLKGTETILLVEDEDSVREVAHTILKTNGYDVLTAGSGAEALDVAAQAERRISLLLTDVIMPGMRGPELARQLVGRLPELKVLYMSGYHDESMFEGYVEGHEPAMIGKPFSPTALARKVREVLDTHEPVASQLVPT